MASLKFLAMGACVPDQVLTNDDLSQMVETDDEWIFTRTGIRSRHIAPEGYTNAYQAQVACEQALARAGLEASDIDVLIVATIIPDHFTPGVSAFVHERMGMRRDAMAFDVNAACCGFLVALRVAQGQLALLGPGSKALVVGSELMSHVTDFTDRTTCVLFGDGAGAAVVTATEGDSWFTAGMAGGSENIVSNPCYGDQGMGINMNGRAVFRFACGSIVKTINTLLDRAGLTLDDVDHVVCHQANARIIRHVMKDLKAPEEKFFMNIETMGNTSAASIPLALEEMCASGRIKRGDRVLLVGFGGGLSEGGMLFTW